MKSVWQYNEVEMLVELQNGHLLSISNHKGVNCYQDEEEVWMGEKHLYVDYSQVEVNETGENGVVMNDKGDGIDRMIGVETVKNGLGSLIMEVKSWCNQPMH
jgi:hypothetical protein